MRSDRRDYADRHPTPSDVCLIVEVSDATLDFDISEKKLDYARSDIAEYWVVDVNGDRVLVFRNPEQGKYQQEFVFGLNAVISLLAFPTLQVSVARFFPPTEE